MTDLRPLTDYATVRTWLDGLRQHWGGDPERDDPERLEILEAFCRYAGTDPDSVIGECVLERAHRPSRGMGIMECTDSAASRSPGIL